jgi:hypothetical protein
VSSAELAQAALASLVIFGAAEVVLSAESMPLTLWVATVRNRLPICSHVATYVLPAEAALGAAVLSAYRLTSAPSTPLAAKALVAAAVAVFYTGALSLSFLFLEGA